MQYINYYEISLLFAPFLEAYQHSTVYARLSLIILLTSEEDEVFSVFSDVDYKLFNTYLLSINCIPKP